MMNKTAESIKIVDCLDSHIEATVAFLRKWNPDHPELASPELLRWQRARRFLALFKNEIVGHVAQIRQTYRGTRSAVTLGWGATLVLDTSNPVIQVFAGTRLLDRLTHDPDARFAAVGVVPEIEETHRRRGYAVRRDCVKMFARFFNPAKALAYLGKRTWLSPALRGANLVWFSRRGSRVGEMRRVESFLPEWDGSWDHVLAEAYELYGLRTAEYLNHKIRQPNKSYVCCVHSGSFGGVDGYLVYRPALHRVKDLRLLKICDLVGTPPARQALLAHALCAAREAKVDGIVALSSASDELLFRRCGMWVSRRYPIVLPPEIRGNIHLTFFDSDLDDLW